MGENRISEGMICAFGVGKDTCQVIYCKNIDCDRSDLRIMSMVLMMMMKMIRTHVHKDERIIHTHHQGDSGGPMTSQDLEGKGYSLVGNI